MPDKLTDNEIKKALEDLKKCNNNEIDCGMCMLSDFYPLCPEKIGEYALDLINRLQAEKQDLEIELQAMRGAANCYKAQVEEFKSAINCFRGYEDKIKAEAYKEFAERLKERPTADKDVQYVLELKTDNLLKELVGETK